jgi:hypothetical protein
MGHKIPIAKVGPPVAIEAFCISASTEKTRAHGTSPGHASVAAPRLPLARSIVEVVAAASTVTTLATTVTPATATTAIRGRWSSICLGRRTSGG